MKKRNIAEMEVSTLCLGTMTFGTPVGKDDAVAMVHWALDQGINFIDTADMYEGYARELGSPGGVAEQILGEALRGRRDRAIITTKAGNPVDGPDSTADISPAHLSRQLDRSLQLLQTDYVDIFELHRPDGKTPVVESVGAMVGFVKEGKARHWGCSNFSAEEIVEMVNLCETGGDPCPVVSQPHYSWLSREVEEAHLSTCRELGIAVTPYRVLESGLLTGKYQRGHPLPLDSRATDQDGGWLESPDDQMYDRLETFQREAAETGLTPAQYAIRWVLDQPAVAACVLGFKRIDQIEAVLPIFST